MHGMLFRRLCRGGGERGSHTRAVVAPDNKIRGRCESSMPILVFVGQRWHACWDVAFPGRCVRLNFFNPLLGFPPLAEGVNALVVAKGQNVRFPHPSGRHIQTRIGPVVQYLITRHSLECSGFERVHRRHTDMGSAMRSPCWMEYQVKGMECIGSTNYSCTCCGSSLLCKIRGSRCVTRP